MPELPEVQTVVDNLKALDITGGTITRASVYWPRTIAGMRPTAFQKQIKGLTIAGISRRGRDWMPPSMMVRAPAAERPVPQVLATPGLEIDSNELAAALPRRNPTRVKQVLWFLVFCSWVKVVKPICYNAPKRWDSYDSFDGRLV